MIRLVFALTGILFGVVLAYIAPEEVNPGKKYLLWLKRIMLLLIASSLVYNYILMSKLIYLVLSSLILINFVLELKFKNKWLELCHYLMFIVSYVSLPSSLLATLIFLYGLPTGTILVKKLI